MARSLELGEALDQPNDQAFALYIGGMSRQFVADRDATLEFARRSVTISEKFGLLPWRAGSLILVAWATAMGGAVADAARLIDAEIEQATSAGAAVIYNLGLAAEVLLAANRPGDAIALLDRVLAAIEEPGVGFYLSEIYRVRGESLLAIDRKNRDEARQAFAVARDIANRQGALVLAHRAEASLLHVANILSNGYWASPVTISWTPRPGCSAHNGSASGSADSCGVWPRSGSAGCDTLLRSAMAALRRLRPSAPRNTGHFPTAATTWWPGKANIWPLETRRADLSPLSG